MNSKNLKDAGAGSRSRAPNFTREEQEIFTKVIEPYIHIIESKKTDYLKQSDKQRAWAKITQIFNANTTHCSRTTDNLISCYRNLKSRMKKHRSEAKMFLEDPSHKEALITAIEDSGKDWASISKSTNVPIEICQMGFEGLKQEIKKNETDHKKKVMGTGGGPPANEDDPFNRIKRIIEPQIEGLFTIYDSDSKLMKQYQETIPELDRIQPIETDYIKNNESLETVPEENLVVSAHTEEIEISKQDADQCNLWETPQGSRKTVSRTDILKKKLHSALNVEKGEKLQKGKKSANDSFTRLADEKIHLIKLNQEVAAEELKERKLNVQLKEIEINHKKKLQELELDNLFKEHIFKEEMRRKELQHIDLKINKLKNTE